MTKTVQAATITVVFDKRPHAENYAKGVNLQRDARRWTDVVQVFGSFDRLIVTLVPDFLTIHEKVADGVLCGYRVPKFQLKLILTREEKTELPVARCSIQIDSLRFEVIFGGKFVVLIEGGYNPDLAWIKAGGVIQRVLEATPLGTVQPLRHDLANEFLEALLRAATGKFKPLPKVRIVPHADTTLKPGSYQRCVGNVQIT